MDVSRFFIIVLSLGVGFLLAVILVVSNLNETPKKLGMLQHIVNKSNEGSLVSKDVIKTSALDIPIQSLLQRNPTQQSGLESQVNFGVQSIKARLNCEITFEREASKYPRKHCKNPLYLNISNISQVGDKIPPENARQILLATNGRSGSSFTGKIFSHFPGTFYSFEPLHAINSMHPRDRQRYLGLIRSLFKCQYDNINNLKYLKHTSLRGNRIFLTHNFRVWKVCEKLLPNQAACLLPQFYQAICPLFPVRLIKSIRLKVEDTSGLLEDPELPNLKVIVLIRDPRGSLNSLTTVDWGSKRACDSVVPVCKDVNADVNSAYSLRKKYPGRVYLLRYEDLCINPKLNTDRILRFLDLPSNQQMDNIIKSITKSVHGQKEKANMNAYGTARNSNVTAFAWRHKIDMQCIHKIQQECKGVMETLGYEPLSTEEQKDDLNFQVITKTAHDIWP